MGFEKAILSLAVLLVVGRPLSAEMRESSFVADCERDVHENCPSAALYNTCDTSGGIFSEDFLNQRCSDVLGDIACNDAYLNACAPDNYRLYALMTNGLTDLFTELCNTTSDLRIGYRKHIGCFKKRVTGFRSCILLAIQQSRRSLQYADSLEELADDEEQQVQALCSFQRTFRICSVVVAQTSCGEEAGLFLDTVYKKGIQNLVTEIC